MRPADAPGTQRRRRGGAIATVVAVASLVSALTAGDVAAGPSPQRTVRIRSGGNPNGPSANPQFSASGKLVAFDSGATNLGAKDPNGDVRDAFVYDQDTGAIRMLSATADPAGANGPSSAPALDGAGDVAVFVSAASNLVANDTNGHSDIFVSSPAGIVRASLGTDGAQPDADAAEPSISADGRFVAFSSKADNLVPSDTNSSSDVFVRDLRTGVTTAVSLAPDGGVADGASSGPAISADGHFVAFTSTASHLVAADHNGVADVFVRDLQANRTERVSVSRRGREQNKAVAKPFSQVSDISADGRYVVFDSDATNLVRRDRNRHTDVFRRDRRRHVTTRVSLATTGQESDNDSFAPSLTPNGRYVAFESFATNLVPDDPAREDVFVHDIARRQTVMADVSSQGHVRGPERTRQLLQRPAVADDGKAVAFVSTAKNLVPKDRNGAQDVFVRKLAPPPTAVASKRVGLRAGRLVITFSSPNPQAGPLLCRLDREPRALCPLGAALLPRLHGRRHRLVAYPGANGSWYARQPVSIRITMGGVKPRVVVKNPLDALGGT